MCVFEDLSAGGGVDRNVCGNASGGQGASVCDCQLPVGVDVAVDVAVAVGW